MERFELVSMFRNTFSKVKIHPPVPHLRGSNRFPSQQIVMRALFDVKRGRHSISNNLKKNGNPFNT